MSLDRYVPPGYGHTTYRSLHSRLLDAILTAPDGVGNRLAAYLGWQLDFAHFVLAIHHDGSIRVVTRLSEDGADAWVGLAMPVDWDERGTEWQLLFELHHRELDLTPDLIVALNQSSMRDALDALIESKP